jgi:DNA polymerase IV
MPQVVHLDIDAFFVSVERQRQPALAGRPLIVGGGRNGDGRVIAASREAEACGVTIGQPLKAAATCCPDAAFVPGQLDAYAETAEASDELVRRYFPRVAWTSMDAAFLDGTALESASRLARAVDALQRAFDAELGLSAACGVATTQVAACAASRLARPRGTLFVLPGYDARFLAPLALDRLPGLTLAVADRLRREGVTTIGELAALSDERAFATAGRSLAPIIRLARALDSGDVAGSDRPRTIMRRRTFEPALTDQGHADGEVERLARQVEEALRTLHLVAGTATIRVTDRSGVMRSETAWVPVVGCGDGFRRAALSASRRLTRTAGHVASIGVRAAGLRVAAEQAELFGDGGPHVSLGARARKRLERLRAEHRLAGAVRVHERRAG